MVIRPLSREHGRPRAARHPSSARLAAALVLFAVLLGPLLGPQRAARADVPQALADQAMLETRQPEVQWSVAGAGDWLTVPERETVRAGDRVRTGPDARARLVYFEGTVIEVEPSTGLLVERLTTSPSGGIVTRLWQTAGVTVSRVVHLLDPAASFEVETPAAIVFVRGTTPRVAVDPDGTSHVRNVPDGTASRVGVRGKDAAQTEVILLPGQETDVEPGQPPAPPRASSPPSTATARTVALPVVPTATPPPAVSSNPCQRPGVGCDPFPTVDPCHMRPSACGPSDSGTTMPPPMATPRPPSPTPTLSPNPCQRPGVVCDPQPPVDPCRLRASFCGPSGQATATPVPTRGLPPPIGDTGGSRPFPTLVMPQPPVGDTGGGRTAPTLPQQPIGDIGGSRGAPTLPQLPIGDGGGIRGVPTLVVSQPPPSQPPSSGPVLR